ncbi:MAG: hypothetical protein K2N00_06505 [Lachnospiraceae bacterium]|nr:hypothetical protein [Lachnospiraceae bacterium]
MDNWIEEQRQSLKKIYEQCNSEGKEEPVLKAFSVYLLRILSGLSQIESSRLYDYEAQILGKGMHLFCIYYMDRVDNALKVGIRIEEKKRIMRDIEDAISKISNVYKNVIDSTSNSDRQMLTSQAVESSIYDISPKLLAAYSVVLETLVRLFHKEKIYAFLLHPSLKSNVETASLFDTREEEGKVVLIYIPENQIETASQVTTYLLHEAFHVLTKKERHRRDRAFCMEWHVYHAIYQRIFLNVNFDFVEGDDADENIKMRLMEKWFDIAGRCKEISEMDDADRNLYSKNVLRQIGDNWREWLRNIFISLGDDLCHVLDGVNYKADKNPYERIPQIEWEIQRNLVEILAGNLPARYARIYMGIYREAYADVACILTAGISPEEYEQSFRNSEMQITDEILSRDIIRSLRIHTVAKAIISCQGVNHEEDWKKYSEEHDFRAQETAENELGSTEEETSLEGAFYVWEEDLKWLEENLRSSGIDLWNELGKAGSGFEKFRTILRDMDLVGILNGKVNESLSKLQ